jgi:hypothetical protein
MNLNSTGIAYNYGKRVYDKSLIIFIHSSAVNAFRVLLLTSNSTANWG